MIDPKKNSLRKVRCANHGNREAAARCPSCGGDFCRECVTELNGKMLCKTCLDKQSTNSQSDKSHRWRSLSAKLALAVLFAFSFFTVWLFFYWSGKALAAIPQKFHITESER